MPKILENVREQLLAEAMKQIKENGYKKLTIRSVAGACKLSVGTVYNYFESKDILVASFMLEDWQKSMESMKCGIQKALLYGQDSEASENGPSRNETCVEVGRNVLLCIYQELNSFLAKYAFLFQDEEAGKVFASAFADRHKMLRGQLQALLLPMCGKKHEVEMEDEVEMEEDAEEKAERSNYTTDSTFLAEFLAENILTWTVAGKDFEEIYEVLGRIIE